MTKSNKSELFFCKIFQLCTPLKKSWKIRSLELFSGLELLRSPHLLLLKTPVVRFGKQLSIPSPPVLFPKKTLQEATFPTLGSEWKLLFPKVPPKDTIYPGVPFHASTGQLFTQRPQWLHFCASSSILPSTIFSASCLQAFTHTPQEIQSSSLYSMFMPPLIPTSFSSAFRQLFWHPVTPNLNLCGSSRPKYLSSSSFASV